MIFIQALLKRALNGDMFSFDLIFWHTESRPSCDENREVFQYIVEKIISGFCAQMDTLYESTIGLGCVLILSVWVIISLCIYDL